MSLTVSFNMLEKIIEISQSKKILHPYDKFCRVFFPLIPIWIKPNFLTAIRLFGTPILAIFLWFNYFLTGLIIFVFLALTDMFDGALARARQQITYIGILFDPIADKLLVGATVAVLLFKINIVLALVVIGLEVLFLFGGLIKTTKMKAVDLEANLWGKVKMNVQVIATILLFFGLLSKISLVISISQGLFWFSAFLALGNLFSRLLIKKTTNN